MSTFIAITISGLALGAVYFLVASGLSLIYGLMDVLNFAHGAFLTLGAYAGWEVASHLTGALGTEGQFAATIAAATAGGAFVALVTEVLLIRPLYGRPISQILVTVGLDLALVGLLLGAFGSNSRAIPAPAWLTSVTRVGAERLPNGDFVALGAGIVVLCGLTWFLRYTRYGLVIRAGVENREMVQALGIDVGRAFTLVFVIGGAAAGLAGLLYSFVFSGGLVDPTQGDQLLIFAFIVVVIGGLGSLNGSVIAAILVGLVQVYVGFYLGSHNGLAELGNVSVVLLLAVVLQARPGGLLGTPT
ncbi:MAG: branched-chain amino acid ABC transporter permease [Actinomycetota bacterium]|jgi:branched-chain amino acid transport system permease protein|nr:branched-chain amino acid ABC transporter permease [Actinomycetota bacterium]